MTETENPMLGNLQRLQHDMTGLRADMGDVKHRLTLLERGVADLHAAMAGQSGRIDRVENRLERIEKRLDLTDA